ncbi:F-box LRR-repeat 20 [Micractinium conductrix]|uniref:RING-type E3 ubiquitin transferase n=1 Tax=Micractinium conductrix TaxID=554055 RepID=A0A2P6VSH7_9CHLO|nr:F-box LRR-repeat 20 [Micractinium conductrix]|eukprot:PSC77025.1 F-box LRR-repeat 20 [Micractinium conductrix]
MRRGERQDVWEDPWGPEESAEQRGTKNWDPTGAKPVSSSSRGSPLRPPARGEADAAQQQRVGPHSLHAICLGVLGEHLGDILEDEWCLREVLPALPTEIKACLLAVARLRRLLSDAALAALADAGQAVLDLHGTGAHVSDAGVRAALRAMPQLRRVDLSSCPVGADTLRALGESCPRVEVLRLGSPATDAGTGRGLLDILPELQQRLAAPAADSWDALLEADEEAVAAALAGRGRLMRLAGLHWPAIPFRVEQRCRASCPKVAINPSPQEAAALRLPPGADASVPLDAPLLAEVAGSERWAAEADGTPAAPVVHIAEKFRLAYISRDTRVRAKMQRNWEQAQRRELRRSSHAEMLIRDWETAPGSPQLSKEGECGGVSYAESAASPGVAPCSAAAVQPADTTATAPAEAPGADNGDVFEMDEGAASSPGPSRSPQPASMPGTGTPLGSVTPPPQHAAQNADIAVERRVVPLLEYSEDTCSICLDDYTREDPGAPTTCGHHFHLQCVMQWAQRSRECPLCFRSLELEAGASPP